MHGHDHDPANSDGPNIVLKIEPLCTHNYMLFGFYHLT